MVGAQQPEQNEIMVYSTFSSTIIEQKGKLTVEL
jgi:hypothetical protein